jgi:hypothetical protein
MPTMTTETTRDTAMDRKAETRREREELNGIAARLLALAGLAESAAGRSLPVRWVVLWYLRLALTVAGDFIAGSASHAGGRFWSPALAATPQGADPAAAFHLAASLRALAVIVRDMAGRVFRLSFLRHGRAVGGRSQGGNSTEDVYAVIRMFGKAAFAPVEFSDSS